MFSYIKQNDNYVGNKFREKYRKFGDIGDMGKLRVIWHMKNNKFEIFFNSIGIYIEGHLSALSNFLKQFDETLLRAF